MTDDLTVEAKKQYEGFIERFAKKHGKTIKEAELCLIVKEYKKYINEEKPNDGQRTNTNSQGRHVQASECF